MEKKNDIIRIALIGPESTAKTTLCGQLAEHYKTVCVKEYAREYLGALTRKYNGDDIIAIVTEQLRREQELLKDAKGLFFADTEPILAKVWYEDLFGKSPAWFDDTIKKNKYDLYLLTYPDLPWEEDPLRENPHRRELLFDWYQKELHAIKARVAVIKGSGSRRLKNAVESVDMLLRDRKEGRKFDPDQDMSWNDLPDLLSD